MDQLHDGLLKQINASCHIEFHWGKDKTLIRHTSIVIKFDGVALFTIDFGPSDGELGAIGSVGSSASKSSAAFTSLALGSSVHVNEFQFSRTKLERQLLKFAISTDLGKNRASNLLLELSRIKMGDYHLLNNNCRDFVVKAMDILSKNKKEYDNNSSSDEYDSYSLQNTSNMHREEMQMVKDEDTEKILAAGVGAGAALLGIGYLGYQLFKAVSGTSSDTKEKRHHNH